jgi:menaquinone-dependent protoporphyrinogen IX oxidase
MTKLLVLYSTSYGDIEAMAGAIAERVREVPSTDLYCQRGRQ